MPQTLTVRNGITAMEAAIRLNDNGITKVFPTDLKEHNIEGDASWGWIGYTLVDEIQVKLDYLTWKSNS